MEKQRRERRFTLALARVLWVRVRNDGGAAEENLEGEMLRETANGFSHYNVFLLFLGGTRRILGVCMGLWGERKRRKSLLDEQSLSCVKR
ncbi:hypothetical protein TIFTF001_017272 [Ficus carica]|uniref:Uncharacterized protein n=1 Tax=Ficus carica TaxID=3494 RepID=A0AA88A4N9_FICCA|nr:hypothetical protein TIFTF001_017272 [Ficus carica]